MDSENHVVVTNIQMPFMSMVWFMVKWAIATIPAVVILFFLGMLLLATFGTCFGDGYESLRT